jgi:hypothetical protein
VNAAPMILRCAEWRALSPEVGKRGAATRGCVERQHEGSLDRKGKPGRTTTRDLDRPGTVMGRQAAPCWGELRCVFSFFCRPPS